MGEGRRPSINDGHPNLGGNSMLLNESQKLISYNYQSMQISSTKTAIIYSSNSNLITILVIQE